MKEDIKRLHIKINGLVQGVGFRPFVAKIARQNALTGFVFNDAKGVTIEVEGQSRNIESFLYSLQNDLPPLAEIKSIISNEIKPLQETDFKIKKSIHNEAKNTLISPDTAICIDCLNDLKDRQSPYFDYPFVNCTNCGPRYTIIKDIPYDRQNTSMADFKMCDSCKSEYEAEDNRRYHAQPVCCEKCGPSYKSSIKDKSETIDLKNINNIVKNDGVGAIKGLGGYHLVCDATNKKSVEKLRAIKNRPHKAMAIMCGSLERVKEIAYVDEQAEKLLTSKERPIVLLPKRDNDILADNISMDNALIGVMLPYTPLHYLILKAQDIWVMTSANRSGNSIIYKDEDIFKEFGEQVDFILTNNREIIASIDDSIIQIIDDKHNVVRRARGYVPTPLTLNNIAKNDILAVGSDLKNTFCLVKGDKAFLSPHHGDLYSEDIYNLYLHNLKHLQKIFEINPRIVVSDLHPNFKTTTIAQKMVSEYGCQHMEVQHHHAHIAAVMAEYGLNDNILGLALDGSGYGSDGAIWGGELFLVKNFEFKRLAHNAYSPLVGGDLAVKEPWRQAIWYMKKIFGYSWTERCSDFIKILPSNWQLLDQLYNNENYPMTNTSSTGRLFDVVACILGLGLSNKYDGQLPMKLECVASKGKARLFNYEIIAKNNILQINFIPLIADILNGIKVGYAVEDLAASFHLSFARAWSDIIEHNIKLHNVNKIIMSGGACQNSILMHHFKNYLGSENIIMPQKFPVNDGGISLGQAWIALHKI